MNIQALMDGMSAQWQRERAETQMTLGKLITALSLPGIYAGVSRAERWNVSTCPGQ